MEHLVVVIAVENATINVGRRMMETLVAMVEKIAANNNGLIEMVTIPAVTVEKEKGAVVGNKDSSKEENINIKTVNSRNNEVKNLEILKIVSLLGMILMID